MGKQRQTSTYSKKQSSRAYKDKFVPVTQLHSNSIFFQSMMCQELKWKGVHCKVTEQANNIQLIWMLTYLTGKEAYNLILALCRQSFSWCREAKNEVLNWSQSLFLATSGRSRQTLCVSVLNTTSQTQYKSLKQLPDHHLKKELGEGEVSLF